MKFYSEVLDKFFDTEKDCVNAETESKRKQEAEANNEYAKVIKEIAEANGITPQELIKNYREKQAEKEADKAGIPVEVYKKLNSLEQEITTLKTQPF